MGGGRGMDWCLVVFIIVVYPWDTIIVENVEQYNKWLDLLLKWLKNKHTE